MATSDSETRMLQTLKHRFPEIPEGIVTQTIHQNPYDIDRCIAELEKESPKYMYGEYQSAVTIPMSNQMQNLHLQDTRPSSASSTSSQQDERRLSNSSVKSAPGVLMHSMSAQEFRGSTEQLVEPQSAPVVQNYRPFDQSYQNSPPQYTSTYSTNVSQQQHTSQYTKSPVHTPYNRSPSGSFTSPSSSTASMSYYQPPQHYVSTTPTRNIHYPGHGTPQKHYVSQGMSTPGLHPPQHYTSSSNRTPSQPQYGSHAQHYVGGQQYEQQQYGGASAATHQQQQYVSSAHQQYTSPGVTGHQQYGGHTHQHHTGPGIAGPQQYASPSSAGPPHHQQQFTSPGARQYINYAPSNQSQYSGSAGGGSPSPHKPSYSATSLHYYKLPPQSGPTHPSSSSNAHNVTFQIASPSPTQPTPGGTSDSNNRVTSTYRFTPKQPISNLNQILSATPTRGEEDILNRSIDGTATPPPPIQPLSPASSHSSLLESPLDEAISQYPGQPPPSAQTAGLTKEQEDYAYTQALLLHQQARFERLLRDLDEEKAKLDKSRHQVEQMERELIDRRNRSSQLPNAEHIGRLRSNNRGLQTDIQIMSREMEFLNSGQVPTVDQSSSFYGNIGSTGAPGPVPPKPPDYSPISAPKPPPPPPPPPPPRSSAHKVISAIATEQAGILDSDEGQQWSCAHCTFLNHPALDKCECCEMPRMI
ncbi:LOW QUALITY PROTEIN: TGF-beta-activated kinase 1 and MAP3K7-binding protein 3-like [Ptychodera flava]|uniref:LOW QUALITY PROTEIN: TGF-beta-activated kinase 1 and MAP3K7-binding protein 3-like n=1 Tax=Ptychodera flava TaxID=63121 RepID=UPI00396A081C